MSELQSRAPLPAEIGEGLVCPDCKQLLQWAAPSGHSDTAEGALVCGCCHGAFPIVRSIPRFVDDDHYTRSFGFQWNVHTLTQIDTHSMVDISRRRFQAVAGWTSLVGEHVLEVGSGAGRFTQLLLETGARVSSVDASLAVEANYINNGPQPALTLLQADLYRMPFRTASFDRVLCLGVLQHCPDVRKAFDTLVSFIKPGGEIVIDVYDLTLRALVNPKYWLRPLTTRMDNRRLYSLVRHMVPILYPVRDFLTRRVPFVGKYLGFLVPVAYHRGFLPGAEQLTYEQQIEWSILDTFDKLSPAYDRPQRIGTVRRWFEEAGFEQIDVRYGPNGIVGRARPSAMNGPRIGFLWHGDRNIGGGEHSTALLVRALAPEFRPVVFYSRYNHVIERYERDGIETCALPWSPSLTGVYRDALTPLRTAANVFHLASAVRLTTLALRRHRIDLVHAVDNLSKIVGGVAARLAGVPVVGHCRDELTHSWVERCLLHYQRFAMDRVIAVADTIADLFARNGTRPSHVITVHNGVDLRQFDPIATSPAADVPWISFDGDLLIGVIAVFDAVKGHRHLFRACAQLKARGIAGWQCLVVGDGREAGRLQALVAELGVSDRVRFLGYRTDVPRILAGVDIVVIPSDQEAFPRIALEAMAMARPVIASRVGGLPEAVIDGTTGILVPPGDVGALTAALEALLRRSDARHQMGREGRLRVERRFSIEENVQQTKRVYADVLGQSAAIAAVASQPSRDRMC